MAIPIIMDCDPGHDDAIALILACASDKLSLRAVTTSSGNQTIEKTTMNARKMLEFLGRRDIPVAMGRTAPLLTPVRTAGAVHGETGLDGPSLPEPVAPLSALSAAELIADTVENSAEKVTLVPTGPLTNIATFILCYPHLLSRIERISLMGGSIVGGCSDKGASEFNVLVDPYAAHIVFHSGIPIVMCGLDVTNFSTISVEEREWFRRAGRVGKLAAELTDYFGDLFAQIGWPGAPMHDACAVAYLIDPSLFQSKALYVDIDLNGENTFGSTVADYNNLSGETANVEVCLSSDRERFVNLLLEACKSYERSGDHA